MGTGRTYRAAALPDRTVGRRGGAAGGRHRRQNQPIQDEGQINNNLGDSQGGKTPLSAFLVPFCAHKKEQRELP